MARSARNPFSRPARSTPNQSAENVDANDPNTVWLGRQPGEETTEQPPAPEQS